MRRVGNVEIIVLCCTLGSKMEFGVGMWFYKNTIKSTCASKIFRIMAIG